jgi:hypothetical protein
VGNGLRKKEREIMADIYKEANLKPNSKPVISKKSQSKSYGSRYPSFKGLIT